MEDTPTEVSVYCCDNCGYETEDINEIPHVKEADAFLCDRCEESRYWEVQHDEADEKQRLEWEKETRQQLFDYRRAVL